MQNNSQLPIATSGWPGARAEASRALQARGVPTRVFACALLLLISTALLVPSGARAATWPVEEGRLSPSLGFHETYTAGASHTKSYVHSGIDASASVGTQIVSPIAGTVCFTGSIPSGDSAVDGGGKGQTMRGVSVKLDDGRVVTLMPFEDIVVSRGEQVAEGEPLGTLAASGDRSSAATHVHMGLKRGSTYYDPMTLFELPQAQAVLGAASESEDAAQEQPAHTRKPSPATSAAGEAVSGASSSMADAAERTDVQDAAGSLQPSTVQDAEQAVGQELLRDLSVVPGAAAATKARRSTSAAETSSGSAAGETPSVQTESQDRFGTISSGAVSWTPQAKGAAQPFESAATAAHRLWEACASQAASLGGSLVGEHALLSPLGFVVGAGIAAVAALVTLAGCVVARRARASRSPGHFRARCKGMSAAFVQCLKKVLVRAETG